VPWIRAKFKDAEVLARCDDQGRLLSDAGRVEIRYRAQDKRAYRAGLENLKPIHSSALLPDDACAPAETAASGARGSASGKTGMSPPKAPDGAIIVYADGACSGNPGPAGVGIVSIDGTLRRELSHFLGEGTNNIAELMAIKLAAESIVVRDRPLRIHTDSQYAIGVLSKGWKAKANTEIVAATRKLLSGFSDLALHYVRGHSGIELNERADVLAVEAVTSRRAGQWVEIKGA